MWIYINSIVIYFFKIYWCYTTSSKKIFQIPFTKSRWDLSGTRNKCVLLERFKYDSLQKRSEVQCGSILYQLINGKIFCLSFLLQEINLVVPRTSAGSSNFLSPAKSKTNVMAMSQIAICSFKNKVSQYALLSVRSSYL